MFSTTNEAMVRRIILLLFCKIMSVSSIRICEENDLYTMHFLNDVKTDDFEIMSFKYIFS